MRSQTMVCVTWLAAFLGLSSLGRADYVIKEKRDTPIEYWSRVSRAAPSQIVSLQIGLKQGRFHELSKHLLKVSHPDNSRYGQHLTADQVIDLVAPTKISLNLVREWLGRCGIDPGDLKYSPAKDWIYIQLTVAKIEKLLQTEYYLFSHNENETAIRALEFSLPDYLHDHIDVIEPTTSFFSLNRFLTHEEPNLLSNSREEENLDYIGHPIVVAQMKKTLPVARTSRDTTSTLSAIEICNASAVTPLCLRNLYGTIDYKPRSSQNSIALANFLGESNNKSDIHQFLSTYRPDAALAGAALNFTIEEIAGGYNRQTASSAKQLADKEGQEGNLDAEIIIGMTFPTPVVAYSTGGEPPFQGDATRPSNTNEPFLTWLQYILAHPDPPKVISVSYGDAEYTVPRAYAKRVCESFAQLGARGVSVLFGSGDFGVGKPGTCHESSTPSNTANQYSKFIAIFPESCPYGTSVGSTRGINHEVVAYNDNTGFVSGGGFSNYFTRPAYQEQVVSSYLDQLGDRYSNFFDQSGRAYPDVSAQGYRIVTVWNGTEVLVDGTSASAPIMASIIALVNDALLSNGRPTLGFLNPWLYERGFEAFNDVIEGNTRGCGTSGFPAVHGWDVASGFGTPWFPKLLELALEKPDSMELPWYFF